MKKSNVRVLVVLAMAGLVALATGCASGAKATPTPTAPPTSAPMRGAAAIAFDKLWVELGTVARDQQGMATFLVMNRGDRPLQVGQVNIQVEQGCDTAETVKGDAEVQPGDVVLLPVRIGPHRELGPHRLLVNLGSSDPDRPVATLYVNFTVAQEEGASVAGPRLRVDKESIDIGAVPFDWPLYEQFTLRNVGDAPLVLEGTPVVNVEEGC